MRRISKAEFEAGYADGFITDVFKVDKKIYGKDSRRLADESTQYSVVWCWKNGW